MKLHVEQFLFSSFGQESELGTLGQPWFKMLGIMWRDVRNTNDSETLTTLIVIAAHITLAFFIVRMDILWPFSLVPWHLTLAFFIVGDGYSLTFSFSAVTSYIFYWNIRLFLQVDWRRNISKYHNSRHLENFKKKHPS